MKTVLICVVLAFSAVLPGRAMSEQEVKVPSLWSWRAPAEKAREHVRGVILLEAEGFTKYGRWRLDTQFIHKMGSAYLIALGVGNPLIPAVTTVEIPQAGTWTVWVRSNDWRPPYAPGKFAVEVGGQEGKVLGASGVKGWRWEKSGTVALAAGEVEVKLIGKAGFFSRCDAILLAEDAAFVPPDDAKELARALAVEGRALRTVGRGGL